MSVRICGLVLGVALTCATGAGCDAGQSDSDRESARHVGTYVASGEGGDAALLEGQVRIIDDCFVVEQDSGTRYLPFFPDDEVAWTDAGLRYRGETYGDGDPIALGGGATGSLDPIPEQCSAVSNLSRWTVTQVN